jgi:hypothetical protein
MSMMKSVKRTLVAIAVAASFFGTKPLVDRVRADQPDAATGGSVAAVSKTYTCHIQTGVTTTNRNVAASNVLSLWSPEVYDAELTISFGAGSPLQSVSLSSDHSKFNNKTLKLDPGMSIGANVYTAYTQGLGSTPDEMALTVIPDGRVTLQYTDFLNKTAYISAIGTCKPASNLVKGVFIRPCNGLFYDPSAFQPRDTDAGAVDPAKLKTLVGGGTLKAACQDLMNAGVTDIFLPFKVDDQESAPQCGAYGQLLYPSSAYSGRVSPKVVTSAQAAGFDPIGSIMSVCSQVYGTNLLRFHAWFPLFQDPYIAQIQGVTGKLKFGLSDNTLIQQTVDRLQMPGDVAYTSHLFADPGSSGVRNQELAILTEIVGAYPGLYGINLDYVRYPEQERAVDVSKPGAPLPLQCIRDPRQPTIQSQDCKNIDPKYIAKRVVWNVDSVAVETFVKIVKAAFPNKTLSADVFSTIPGMDGVGQVGLTAQVPAQLDIIMPMTYSYFGQGGDKDTQNNIAILRGVYPTKQIVACVRGWASPDPQSKGLIKDLTLDIAAVKNGGANGYAVFTYETLLTQTNSGSLLSIKEVLGF